MTIVARSFLISMSWDLSLRSESIPVSRTLPVLRLYPPWPAQISSCCLPPSSLSPASVMLRGVFAVEADHFEEAEENALVMVLIAASESVRPVVSTELTVASESVLKASVPSGAAI